MRKLLIWFEYKLKWNKDFRLSVSHGLVMVEVAYYVKLVTFRKDLEYALAHKQTYKFITYKKCKGTVNQIAFLYIYLIQSIMMSVYLPEWSLRHR